MDTPLHLKPDRAKLLLFFLGVLGFVACSLWIAADAIISVRPSLVVVWSKALVGMVGAVGFGYFAIGFGRRLMRPGPGLILREDGIILNDHGPSVGLIEWADLTGCQTAKPFGNLRILVLMTDKSEKYRSRLQGGMHGEGDQANTELVGSPLWIETHTLSESHDRIAQLISDQIIANRR